MVHRVRQVQNVSQCCAQTTLDGELVSCRVVAVLVVLIIHRIDIIGVAIVIGVPMERRVASVGTSQSVVAGW